MNYKNILLSTLIVISACYAPAAQAMMSPTPAQDQQTSAHQGFKLPYIERRFWTTSVEIEGKPYIIQMGKLNQYLINCASLHMNAIIQISNHLITHGATLTAAQHLQLSQKLNAHTIECNRIVNSINKNTTWLGLPR